MDPIFELCKDLFWMKLFHGYDDFSNWNDVKVISLRDQFSRMVWISRNKFNEFLMKRLFSTPQSLFSKSWMSHGVIENVTCEKNLCENPPLFSEKVYVNAWLLFALGSFCAWTRERCARGQAKTSLGKKQSSVNRFVQRSVTGAPFQKFFTC